VTLSSLRVALRGILANRMRSSLTTLGILIGTGSVILLVAVGTGISNQVQAQIGKLGTNAVYVLNEKNPGGDKGGTNAHEIKLTKADLKALRDGGRVPDVLRVSPLTVAKDSTVTWGGYTYSLGSFIGAEAVFGEIRNLQIRDGHWFSDADEASRAKVAAIGLTVADRLFTKGTNPIGQTIQVNGVPFEVTALLEKRGSNGLQDQDDVIFAPLATVIDNVVGNLDSYTAIAVQANSREAIDPAVAEVTRTLRETHHLAPGQPQDFKVFNAADLLAAGKATARSFQTLLAIVAAITLLIGGIGVMNIMLVTVTERTREIGIRKSLGAFTKDIMTQFLAEAVLLAGIGGVLGSGAGIFAGHFRIAQVQPDVSTGTVILAFAVSVLIGVFFGAYPASRAAALRPIQALRYE
jgi:putative ABC transport system permease protein